MRRALVEISRVRPAQVPVPGTAIWVNAGSQERDCSTLAAQLAALLETEVLGADSRLRSDEVQADAILDLSLLRCDGDASWESRRVTVRKKVGQDSRGKAIYRDQETTVRYQVVSAHLVVAYKAVARRSGDSLDADSFDFSFSEEYADGRRAPTVGDVQNQLMRQVVSRIVPRLAATDESIRALLPKGTLEDLIPLAEAGLWNRYLEALERKTPRTVPAEEAYRRYATGLAYEALGYGADDPDTTLRYLEQAALEYDEALNLNPAEKYFTRPFEGSWAAKAGKSAGRMLLSMTGRAAETNGTGADAPPPIERVRSALASYRQVISQKEELASLGAGPGGYSGGKALDEGRGTQRFGNDQVVDMVHAGLSETIIVRAIEETESCTFDLSPQGLIQLSKAKVPEGVIEVMQKSDCEGTA